ncbi:MAG: copper amine oxidase N-terminal domain-containing protein [Clostridia bacterium]|nr:copper amine oxidase N-terminal domain-containing protein [Clostridia bacterium]
MKKKLLYLFMLQLILLSTLFNSAYAAASTKEITVILDGSKLSFDVPPAIENGRTLVPFSAIFTALGADIYWDNTTKTVSAIKGDVAIALQIGNKYANKNNSAVLLDVPPKIIKGRTMVPLGFVSKAFGCNVVWKADTRTIIISSPIENTEYDFIIGSWSSQGPNGTMFDPSTGQITGSSYTGQWYKFNKDGTYRYIIAGSGPIITGCVVVDGRYAIDGDTIKFYDAKETSYRNFTGPQIKDSPIDDDELDYTYHEDDDTISMNFSRFYRIVD